MGATSNDISVGHADYSEKGKNDSENTDNSETLSVLPLKLTTHAFSNSFPLL